MDDGSGAGVAAMDAARILSPEDLRRVHEIALRWAGAGQSVEGVHALTTEALGAAAQTYDAALQPDFLVHALLTVRQHLRQACRSRPPARR